MQQDKEFRWVEFGVKSKSGFHRNIMVTPEDIETLRARYGNTGVFATAYRYANMEKRGRIYAPFFYIDLDMPGLFEGGEEAWQRLRRDFLYLMAILDTYYGIKKNHTAVYFSGCKGLSVLIPSKVFGLEPCENLNDIFHQIASDIHTCHPGRHLDSIDLRIYDRVRMWRLVNSRHEKSGLYKVRIAHDEVLRLGLDEIKAIAKNPREDPPPVGTAVARALARVNEIRDNREVSSGRKAGTLKYMPPCVKNVLTTTASKGTRNNIATALASYFKQTGMDIKTATARLLDWNRAMCQPRLDSREVVRSVNSVYKHDYKFGCRTFKQVALCTPEECRFGK